MRGGLTSVNWDVDELEKHAERIQKEGLTKMSWVSSLPLSGGAGLEQGKFVQA